MTTSQPDDEAIFHAARQIPDPQQRSAFIRLACGKDERRIAHIEALVSAAETEDSLLDRPAFGQMIATIDELPDREQAGSLIAGKYKLLEPIGEGGMGTVWMAQQTEPVKRLVAVKLVKPGMDSRQVLARFEAERQALALMDHPNIAKVLDAGTTGNSEPQPSGSGASGPLPYGRGSDRPYFVMELVKGQPITKYCDEHHLTLRQRLELFIPVCHAVQHAHQKGIVHRDLKPSNVLVAPYDGQPVPKVIDFGVAKAMGQPLTEQTLVTGFGAIVGTLEYMSPEQAELNNHDIDTRSDIYALGVLLYELLTGTTPLEPKCVKESGLLEALRIIREEEVPTLSNRLSSTAELPSIAANRGTEPARLTKLVRGELDWIVMKSLEKDRNRRYETASALAQDVQRYLNDEPVQACPPSLSYRLGKLVRKHRIGLVATGAVLLTLVAGLAGTTWGLVRYREAAWAEGQARKEAEAKEREARAERDQKEKQRQRAEVALAAEIKARAAARESRDQALAALRVMTDELVENQLARAPALTEENKEFLRKIIKQFEELARITAADPDHQAIRAEGYARVAIMRYRLGELNQAEADFNAALSLKKDLAEKFPSRFGFRQALAQTHLNRGSLRYKTGRLKEAEADYHVALSTQKQLVDEFPKRPKIQQELATTHNNLGTLLRETGRWKEAEARFDAALTILGQLPADFQTDPDFRSTLAGCYLNRGSLLYKTGRWKEAEADFDAALAIQNQLVAEFPTRPKFRQELAQSHTNRGNLVADINHLTRAEADFDAALAIQKRLAAEFPTRPEFRQELARCYLNRGNLLYKTGRLKEAEFEFNTALSIRKQLAAEFPNVPEFRQDLAASHNNFGFLLDKTGRLKEAEAEYDASIAIRKQLAAEFPNQPEFLQDLAITHNNRGSLLKGTGQLKEAEVEFEAALSIRKQLVAEFPNQPEFLQDLAVTHNNLGSLLLEIGRLKEAEGELDAALNIRKQLVTDFPNQPHFRQNLALSYNNRGSLMYKTGRFKEAEEAYLLALNLRKQLFADFPNHPEFRQELAYTHHNRGILLSAIGRLQEAEAEYDAALAIRQQLATDFPNQAEFRQNLATSHNNRGSLLFRTGRLKESEAEYQAALAIRKELATNFPTRQDYTLELATSHNNRGNLLVKAGRLKEAEEDYNATLAICKPLAIQFPSRPEVRHLLAGTSLNLAILKLQQKNLTEAKRLLEEGQPQHLAALKTSPNNPTYRQSYRNHLQLLARVHAGLLEPVEAVRTAQTRRDLGWDPPADAFAAACLLSDCIPIVAKHDKLDETQRKVAVEFYCEKAMGFMREAIAQGFNDTAQLKTNPSLALLRPREDFQELVNQLEEKTKR